jgi:hypothetical protein
LCFVFLSPDLFFFFKFDFVIFSTTTAGDFKILSVEKKKKKKLNEREKGARETECVGKQVAGVYVAGTFAVRFVRSA